VANSAAYRPPQPIVSMPQAISRLGFRTLCDIAIAVTLKGRIFQVPRFDAIMRSLWMHSAAAGAYAKEIARLRRRNVEGAFLCGLLHDIGRPVILQFAVDAQRAADRTFADAEIAAVCDALHARVGAALIRRWEFPEWMVAAVEHHHDPDGPDQRDETRVTALADHLAHWALDSDVDDTQAVVGLPLLIDLNIYEDEIRGLLQARDAVREVALAFA
jgi:putative nucleotidyltransferase with HDIG domain